MPALAFLGGIVAFFGIWAIGALWGGYVLTVLWAWFIVPTFHLPPLSLVAAIGMSMVIGYLTSHIDMEHKSEIGWGQRFANRIVVALLKPLFALFFGWIIHLFM